MPREQITRDEFDTTGNQRERAHVHVGWNKVGEWVQVSLAVSPQYARFGIDQAAAEAKRFYAGRDDMQVDEDTFVAMQPVKLFSDSLTRTEINDLIRVLRRARDQAFGRDE